MAEQHVKLTRKEKIAAGIPKPPKRKKARAQALKAQREDQVKVVLKNYRSSARKARLVVDQIRGMEVFQALAVLKLTTKRSAVDIHKLLKSAIFNWEEKFEERVEQDTLYVKEAYVDSANMLRRLRPAPQGRAHIIRKRFCHITLVVDEIPYEEEEDEI